MTNADADVSTWEAFDKANIRLVRILGSYNNGCRLACLCNTDGPTNEDKAVMILEKLPLSKEDVETLMIKKTEDSSLIFANDVYHTFKVLPAEISLNYLKATVIHPATEEHIVKYSVGQTAMIVESADDYRNVVEPYIKQKQLSLRWVDNILNGTAEAERVIFSDSDPDTGFVVLPDMKWDGVQEPENRLYLVAIVRCKNLFSIRDLNPTHTCMLEKLLNGVPKVIEERYGIKQNRLRIFFHYLPSYWHLHVHYVVADFVGEDSGRLWSADRAHFLTTVISNIQLMPDFYRRCTLTYSLRIDSPLHLNFLKNDEADQ